MKKLTLLLLLMVSTSVFAEWTEVGQSANGMTAYADFGTIKRKGNKVKMWRLYDFKTVQKSSDGIEYLSEMRRGEYDCEEETIRQLDVHWYSGNMRQSEIVRSITNIKDEAESVMPGSINETLLKVACGKK